MTEAEFSHLLSNLSTTAKALNTESDSINDVIKALEAKLRHINLGVEVWRLDEPIESESLLEEDRNGDWQEVGTIDDELGFTKDTGPGEWSLAVRRATYRKDNLGQLQFRGAQSLTPLLQCSRKVRIEALKLFPQLVKQMDAEAKAALAAIETAKKLLK